MTIIACRQLAPVVGELEANSALTVAAIREAVSAGADVVVLPELATSGYVFDSRPEAARMAISAGDPLFRAWAREAAAGPAVVVGGFCELGTGGRLHSSAAVVDASGLRAVYRKTHLWDREKLFFAPGEVPPPVLDTAFGRLGVLICYDLEFPEMPRALALRGADLIAVPVNWPLLPRPPGEHPPEVVAAMAAARASRLYIACCDRGGTERGQKWTEGTAIVDRDGWVAGEGALARADLDLTGARDKAWTERSDALGDRRPALYGSLVNPLTHT